MNKIHKCIYTERERILKSPQKELWKFQVNKTNFGGIFVSKYIYMMHQILDLWNFIGAVEAYVHFFYFCHQNKTFKKLSKMLFILPKSSFCPQHFQIFVLHSSSFFAFLGHCWFYQRSWLMINTNVYGISMTLTWILKTLIL